MGRSVHLGFYFWDDVSGRITDLVITVCWLAFWIYWLIAARTAKSGQSGGRRFAGARVAIVVIVVFLARDFGFRGHPRRGDPALTAVGLVLFFAGLGLASGPRLYIGRNWGMPMTRRDEPELVTTGPYRRGRDPPHPRLILAPLPTPPAPPPFP